MVSDFPRRSLKAGANQGSLVGDLLNRDWHRKLHCDKPDKPCTGRAWPIPGHLILPPPSSHDGESAGRCNMNSMASRRQPIVARTSCDYHSSRSHSRTHGSTSLFASVDKRNAIRQDEHAIRCDFIPPLDSRRHDLLPPACCSIRSRDWSNV